MTASTIFAGLAFFLPLCMAAFVISVVGKAIGDFSKRHSKPAPPTLRDIVFDLARPAGMELQPSRPDWHFDDPAEQARFEAWWGSGSGEPFMKKPPLSKPPAFVADSIRMEELEDWCTSGIFDAGIEVDGGVYLTVHIIGEESIELRERNCLRDAIDEARAIIHQRRIEQAENLA